MPGNGDEAWSDRDKAQLDLRSKAIGFAIDWSKHLATLATGTIVVSGTFLKDLLNNSRSHKWLLMWSWGFMVASLIASSLVVGALITTINNPNRVKDIDVYSGSSQYLAAVQAVLLFAGLVMFVVFVSLNF